MIDALNGLSIKPKEVTADQMLGYEIVKKACFAPFKKILENCGVENYYTVLRDLADVKTGDSTTSMFTYNAKTGTIVNAMEVGLLDPAKVTRTAIENAASVAGTILTTESVIFEKKDDKKGDQGMDMMPGF